MSKTAWEPAPLPKEGTCGSCAHLDRKTAFLSYPAKYQCKISGKYCLESDACKQSAEEKQGINYQIKTLGDNIKYWLEIRRISQRELAKKIGTTEVSVSRYVTGQRAASGPLLFKMARALGCTVEDLMQGVFCET